MQDSYDLLTGKTKIDELLKLAAEEGPRKAERLKRPLVSRESFPGSVIPKSVLDVVEPLYFNVRESLEKKKKQETISNQVVVALKEVAPERIENLVQLYFALVLFFWIFLITKLTKMKGQLVVDTPRLTRENQKLVELGK